MLAFLLAVSMSAAEERPSPPEAALAAVDEAWQEKYQAYAKARYAAKLDGDRARAELLKPKPADFATQYRTVADNYPHTAAEVVALFWMAMNAADTPDGKAATRQLLDGRIAAAPLADLVRAVERTQTEFTIDDYRHFHTAMLKRVNDSPKDAKNGRLCAWVCIGFMENYPDTIPADFQQAADLIATRYANSPDVSHFGEMFFLRRIPAWAGQFETHLRTVAEKNPHVLPKATARLGLANVIRSTNPTRQTEALELYRGIVRDYENYSGNDSCRSFLRGNITAIAKSHAKQIEHCGIGKPAREIDGVDLDGKPIKLSDSKGKVVLLVFWASWCGPCLRDVPHEIELAARFQGRPFVLLGVNSDPEREVGLKAAAKAGMPWRSVWNFTHGKDKTISSDWAVEGWPTTYLIDHEGIIRHYNLRGAKLDAPLAEMIEQTEAARKK